MKKIDNIIEKALFKLKEQTAPNAQETDNAPASGADSPFTPAEERFLGKFDAYGSEHLGVIYSKSDIGIEEFIARSGTTYNVTPGILLSLMKQRVIDIVPYGGFGRDSNYTLKLMISLDDIAGMGAADKAEAEKGSDAAGAPVGGEMPPAPAPAPEVAWVVKYGDVLSESAKAAKKILSEKKSDIDVKIHADKSRVLKNLPNQYVKKLEDIIKAISKNMGTTYQKERVIADILDNLQVNLDLSADQISASYNYHKNQKKLQKLIGK